jgi:hypothetical protein
LKPVKKSSRLPRKGAERVLRGNNIHSGWKFGAGSQTFSDAGYRCRSKSCEQLCRQEWKHAQATLPPRMEACTSYFAAKNGSMHKLLCRQEWKHAQATFQPSGKCPGRAKKNDKVMTGKGGGRRVVEMDADWHEGRWACTSPHPSPHPSGHDDKSRFRFRCSQCQFYTRLSWTQSSLVYRIEGA